MSIQSHSIVADDDLYAGLKNLTPTLEADDYRGAAAFEADLKAIWYRNWVYVGRSSQLAEARSFRVERIGTQEILLLRDDKGTLNGFHNTCRHRGAALKREDCGRLKGPLLVCPYHAWSYAKDGRLIRVPSATLPEGFDRADYGLYRVRVEEWRGSIFVNLSQEDGGAAAETFDAASANLDNWPLENLVVGHRLTKTMACNWKVFWENFNECLHCAGVHPELSALVPIYGRGFMARHDDPHWKEHEADEAPEFSGRLREGAETWSSDGKAAFSFDGLSQAERTAGQSYATHLPSMFVVGHVDYVRVVSLRPLSPETTQLTAEWLFPQAVLESPGFDMENIISFGSLVLQQDADICEVNQRGLVSMAHRRGVLMPEEYDIARFHAWVRAERSRA